MTTEEKARAYDEALKRADSLTEKYGGREFAEYVFPELRESEDERIRKAILGLTYLDGIEPILTKCSITAGDIRTYLEKQKEQKPAEWNTNDKAFIKDCARILDENGYAASAERLLSMFPVKPAEWSDEDEKNLKSVVSTLWFALNTPHFPLNYERIIELETWLKSLHPVKQEWSEEDERFVRDAIAAVEAFYSEGCGQEELIDWLKSLRPQPQGTYKQVIHTIFGMLKDKDFYEIQPSHRVSLLNDIRVKCKDAIECAPILDEPSWKPSEGQMSMLLSVINDPNNAGAESCQLALRELYNQLKGLKEGEK